MQRIERKVVLLIKPGAHKVIQPEASEARKSEGIEDKRRNGLLFVRLGLVVEQVDRTIANLEEVYVPSEHSLDCRGKPTNRVMKCNKVQLVVTQWITSS